MIILQDRLAKFIAGYTPEKLRVMSRIDIYDNFKLMINVSGVLTGIVEKLNDLDADIKKEINLKEKIVECVKLQAFARWNSKYLKSRLTSFTSFSIDVENYNRRLRPSKFIESLTEDEYIFENIPAIERHFNFIHMALNAACFDLDQKDITMRKLLEGDIPLML